MTFDEILNRFDCVRRFGSGRATARCSGHQDKRASLSIRELDDGTVLLHCFAGCEPLSVVQAIGLEYRDLFPDRGPEYSRIRGVEPHEMPRLSAVQALESLDHEAMVVALIGADILEHREIDAPTWQRLAKAISLIRDARAVCCPAKVPARE
jgi:hypothetical protein